MISLFQVRVDHSLHPTGHGGPRPFPRAGELER